MSQRKRQSFVREDPDQRRQAMIQATLRCLARDGYAKTGVRAIAEEAGVSIGLIRHYFETKSQLIAATQRHVSIELQAFSERAVEAAGTDPRDRLRAYLMSGFRPPFLDEKYITVRFMLWGVALTDPATKAVHDEGSGRYRARLGELIAQTLPPTVGDAVLKPLAATVSALTDGFWIDWILRPEDRDIAASIDLCLEMVASAGAGPTDG
ncbi:MAG: TetR/AcrR family transcriptional regulator [Hyphomicrobiales bacterium]